MMMPNMMMMQQQAPAPAGQPRIQQGMLGQQQLMMPNMMAPTQMGGPSGTRNVQGGNELNKEGKESSDEMD